MDVLEALKRRKSTRAFLDKVPSEDLIKSLLDGAKLSPSGVNMQPWELCVVSKDKKKQIESKVLKAFDAKKSKMDYQYYPKEWKEPYNSRRKEMGLLMYKTLEITREDKVKQAKQWKKNYEAFGAPIVVYFFIDKTLGVGSWLDYGMFLQSFMLLACERGLATCPMASLAEFPNIVREELEIDENKLLLCGIALGYEDKNAKVNSFKTSRIGLKEFCKFYS